MSEPKTVVPNVDDNEAGRYAVTRILCKAGMEAMDAATGGDALETAPKGPDSIHLDVNLPDLSGLEVCRRIKEDPAPAMIPRIHPSATHFDDESIVQGRRRRIYAG